jgi:uncharacterized repeat protein (TIGR01451 family)/CSLREA domain-containing protein
MDAKLKPSNLLLASQRNRSSYQPAHFFPFSILAGTRTISSLLFQPFTGAGLAGITPVKKLISVFILLAVVFLPARGWAQVKTFTVNMTSDESDPNAGNLGDDGKCDIDPLKQGDQCTLRAAIENHNGNRNLGQNEIKFNIPNAPGTGSIVIKVGGSGLGKLPNILGSAIIKAKNEPDGRRIELDGSLAGANAIGLSLLGGECQISSFIINNFSSHGIFISGTPPPGGGSHVIKGNYIGTDATGKISKGNGGDGIFIDNTPNDTIGGTVFDDLNIISGNKGYGIVIHGSDPQIDFLTNGARNNMVKGNFIGLDVDGNLVLPNEKGGILNENAPNNRYGDSTDNKAANKLAGTKNGITILGSLSEGVGIEGNFFTNGAGAKFSAGIFGRGGKGLYITGNLLEDIDSTAIDLFLDANGSYNIHKNRFQGSLKTGTKLRFGPGRTAEIDYTNNFHTGAGLSIDAEESLNSNIDWLFLGDTMRAGQAGANMIFRASGKKNFTNNRWEGMSGFGLNYVTDLGPGVQATLTETNELYSNNGTEGVHGRIQGSGELALNIFDTKSTGSGTDGSRLDVFVSAGAKVDIAARGNEYTFCARAGLRLTGDGQKLDLVNFIFERNLADHNNFVGLELFNSAILRKSISNNTITNNGGPGIQLDGTSDAHIDNNTISGNTSGILINDAAVASINNNSITGNGRGIALAGSGAGIAMSDNSIFNNTVIGLDLGNDGPTLNDAGDIDTGPNNLQNFPVLTAASPGAGNIRVQGTLNSIPNTTFRLEFFSSTACSPSGFGEGQSFLGFAPVTTDGSGNASFDVTLAGVTVPAGSSITSTATDPANNTSEFSKCLQFGQAQQQADLKISKTADKLSLAAGANVTFTILVGNAGPDQATGISVSDQLPAGVSFVSATPSQGAYNQTTGIWTIGTLNNGSLATLVLIATATQAGTITNTAAIKTSDQPDGNTANNTTSVTITVLQQVSSADLQLVKTANKVSVVTGEAIVYTLTLVNKGPDQATGITVSDKLPAGISFVSATPSQGNYDQATGIWMIGTLASGNQATLTISANAVQPGVITNTAQVSAGNQPDPNTANNQSSVAVTVQPEANIALEIQGLTDKVNALVASGKLSRLQGKLLMEVLQAASQFYKQGKTSGAISALRTFNLLVAILTNISQLSNKNAHELIDAAQKIITELQAGKPGQAAREMSGDRLQEDNTDQDFLPATKYISLDNYPNPFGQATVISFELTVETPVQLNIYDNDGRILTRLLNKSMPAGKHTVGWQAGDRAAGIYLVELRVGELVKTHQMVHVK